MLRIWEKVLNFAFVMSRKREEAIAAGVKVNDVRHSMKRRKPWHDYQRKGIYMLTMVVEGRLPVLGRGVSVRAADADREVRAHVELTELGKAIRDEEVKKISAVYKMVEVWKLCIMPDHIHMIVRVKEDMPAGKHLGNIVAGFKGGCSRAWWRIGPCADGKEMGPCADAQGVVAGDEMEEGVGDTTRVVSATGEKRPSLFERGYNDQILIEEGQLDNWKHYLDDNPRRLAIKRLSPDYFTTMHYVDISEWHCQTVGNRFLLDIPQKVAVIVHHAYTDAEYAKYKQEWLACGEAGSVLVSAAIATREKEVMREAMNRGYRIILVRENGFPPLYKPSGESFDACSDGRLLQVSPWEYHMQRRTISREQCLMLNRLVEDIVRYL